jgi:hypothetical protein
MMVDKVNHAPNIVTARTDDLLSKNDHSFHSNRGLWFISWVMLIAVISLAVGLVVGLKSSGTPESVSKLSWPELVAMDAENASAWTKENYPEYNVYVVNYGEYVTGDFDAKRVRIYKAPNGTVYTVPKVGR